MFFTIIIFIAIICLLVFAHEIGHFISAKKAGVAVEEFGFGFPPRLFSFKKKETIYSINLIPIGGFVKIKGESGRDSAEKDSFVNKKFWQKSIILGSGVTMNIFFAFILITIGLMIGLPTIIDDEQPLPANITNQKIQIATIYEKSAADLGGLKIGDVILTIDGQSFPKVVEMQKYIKTHQNNSLSLEIERGKEKFIKEITPALIEGNNEKLLGVNLVSTGLIHYNFFLAIYHGFLTTFSLIFEIITALYWLIRGAISGANITNQLAGPVGVAVLTSQVTKLGFIYLIQFTALLSLNLAIINILPFPALDGGRILFIIIEKIRGKPNNEKIESLIHNIGFSLLMILIVFVTYRDLLRYGQKLINNLKGFFS